MAQITLRDYLRETEDAIRDDRIDDAFTHCQNILAQLPESLDAQRLLGEAYLAQGQLEEARQSFDWILTNDPENVVAYCNRALISERSLDYNTALDCYQQAYELSHGHSQIRQEFNRLSAETGPQGFMFSRAGLARLYMRGDLLTQAIQEWEAVLAVNPDRLDARTGLLETCWREAHYDRVEQLATQILQEVPGCLKPLLLLAYVNSAKNMQRAQELLRRAEALDPDLLMAQELFSDFMARQPAEPFLQLLKKAPVTVETSLPRSTQSTRTPISNLQGALAQSSGVSSLSSQALAAWNDTNWAPNGNDITLIKTKLNNQLVPESSPVPVWSAEAAPALDVWSALDGSQNVTNAVNPLNYGQSIQSQSASTQLAEQSQETWLPEFSANMTADNKQKEAELSPWDTMLGSVSESGIWGNSAKEGSMPSPPAWLNMLTQSEIQQLNNGGVVQPAPIEDPVASILSVQPTQKEQPVVISKATFDEEEEGVFFGPELLKSMGATSIENQVPSGEASLTYETEEKQSSYAEPQPGAFETPEHALPGHEKVAGFAGTEEYDLLATLEGLEAGLRSQGFVPLQPNSLQAIAKTQETTSPPVPKTPELATQQEALYQNASLPSALDELGSFAQEPEWLAFLNTVPAPSPVTSFQQEMLPHQEEQIYSTLPSSESSWSTAYASHGTSPLSSVQEEIPYQPQEKEPDLASPIFGAAQSDQLQMNRPQEVLAAPLPAPSAHSETRVQARQSSPAPSNELQFNSELEMTMKRPAVRLQPMQLEHSFGQNDPIVSPARPRMAEQTNSGRTAEGSVSNQERLLKGYQHQLVGDYDEAMQEYRIIIRNSPELLSEVVSNVRALLKLAPKYSTGYRVLGDAYMRQGEYLQAMEAYNKALTMAKRAKA